MTPIKISGATGKNCNSINDDFLPTTEVFGGQMVYKKQGSDKEVWLEFRQEGLKGQWFIVSAEGKGGKSTGRYAYSTTGISALIGQTDWEVNDEDEKTQSQSLAFQQKNPEPLHDNFKHCVKETQIRLWCYRKVVHKAFCDTIAKFVRYQFPRRLKDHVETVIYKSLQVDAADGNGSSSPLALMAETEELSRKRKALQTSVRKHEEALKVMVDLKRQKLA